MSKSEKDITVRCKEIKVGVNTLYISSRRLDIPLPEGVELERAFVKGVFGKNPPGKAIVYESSRDKYSEQVTALRKWLRAQRRQSSGNNYFVAIIYRIVAEEEATKTLAYVRSATEERHYCTLQDWLIEAVLEFDAYDIPPLLVA